MPDRYRKALSGPASGPAHKAAVIAARLMAQPPNGAVTMVARPVVTKMGPGAGS